jgi:hypothetical protein
MNNLIFSLCPKSDNSIQQRICTQFNVYIEGSIIEQTYKGTEQACQNLEIGFFGVTFVKDSY